jgi:uncharacterized phage protein (TIGR01671 family)
MNREILFRAKHIHTIPGNEHLNGTWVHGYLSDENYIYDKSLEGEFLIDEDTICQYTGLTEKNGKKIFENDIVQVGWYNGTVEYEDGCFVIKWNNIKFLRKDLGYWANLDGFQTIGNIYDNPELLEEEDVHGTD